MRKLIIYGVLLLLLASCRKECFISATDVLEQNPRWEEVLEACGDDSLKRQAALFLLENLPYYYSYERSTALDAHLKTYELYGTGKYSLEEVQDSVRKLYGNTNLAGLRLVSDVKIKPDLLIDHLDWAFKVWREQPWGKNVSFRDFCEYILPYRIKDEPLKAWREEIYKKYNPMLDAVRKLPEAEDPLFVARVLLDSVSREDSHFNASLGYGPHVGPDLVKWVSGNCRELTDRLIYIFRAVGIPCGCDYMPLRGELNVAHYWNFVQDKYGDSYYMYEKRAIEPVRTFFGARSKIYRQTFSLNRDMQAGKRGKPEDVWPGFRYPCSQDVTRLYSGKNTYDFVIPVEKCFRAIASDEVVYLCASTRLDWQPVAWTYPSEEGMIFKEVAGGVVLRLAVYESGRLVPVSEPFELNKETGGIHYFKVSDKQEEVCLLNKYNQLYELFPQHMVGGVFEGSNSRDFSVKDTLFVIKQNPLRLHNVVVLRGMKPYRYVRYYGPENSYCDVSEVAFYETAKDTCALQGKPMGASNAPDGDLTHDYTNVFDGDHCTSFRYRLPSGGWAGLDLGCPYRIGKIVFTPRNRDNYIYKGETYELFYSSQGEWNSAGTQVAVSDSLLYTVPKGALFYLKNYTRGKDERIFEYDEGIQRYW